jgi:transcription elongation GreA/GreB family factor
MSNYFTQQGLELRYKRIKAQEEKVKSIGKEAGEAAGISCDWHDNFAYEDAKRRLEMESMALQKMREEVSGAQIISVKQQSDQVAIGVTVKLTVNGEKKEYTIGAFGESDPAKGLISYDTPLARSLLKLEVGDTKAVKIGGKLVEVEVEEIHSPSYRYHTLIAELARAD